VLVLGSLPESAIEAGGEQGAAALDRLTKIFGRVQSAWAAAQGSETYEIIRLRLFEPLDEDAEKTRDQAVKAYVSYYRANPGEFPAPARERAFEDLNDARPAIAAVNPWRSRGSRSGRC
jgi:hypothetical protein